MDNQTHSSDHSKTATWTAAMDRYFIDLMLEHMIDKADGHLFRRGTWKKITSLINEKFRLKYKEKQVKNRRDVLKKVYNKVKKLVDQTGFIWDATHHMVTADDCVWDNYIKVHRKAQTYRNKPVPYYLDLCRIYRDRAVAQPNSDQINANIANVLQETTSGTKEDLLDQGIFYETTMGKIRSQDDGRENASHEMADVVPSSSDKKTTEQEGLNATENVIHVLQAVPDIEDDDLILDACDLLEDEKKAKTFLSLHVRLRKKWLVRKLRPGQPLV